MRHVTIRQLQLFVAAAETLSFARVAENLHLTPAGVSFQIKQIEALSGFALFERVGKKAALTEAGRTLLGHAKQVLRSLEDADQAMMALKGLTGGQVTIGLVSTAKYLVPHMLARFRAEHPGIVIHLREGNRREINSAIVNGEIDLAVMGQPLPGVDVTAEPFAPHPSVIIAAPDHPLAAYPPADQPLLPAGLLAGENFVLREEGSGTRALFDRFFDRAGFAPRVAMMTSSNETIKQAVMAGMGVALISGHTIGLELRLGLLTTLAVEGFPLMRSWFVAHRRNMPLLPVHRHLRSFFLEKGESIIDELDRDYRRLAAAGAIPAS
ncbi:LysR family transcriptional regulator [Aliidongia dinghuensis]|uniref:HTH-type transcriptional regulator CbbR n=1 Tax=Aliidongia dinghuensis TaxID=1867774 RepID=A0A8J2YNM7_9PROT|nr:LysR family transcriptional regulator [Aliidongia dinghuensis]GGE98926.1 LysR family transcriptional regulator [Aliidongia dinghuensis]